MHHGVTRGLGGKRCTEVKCNPHGVDIPFFFVISLQSVQTRLFGASGPPGSVGLRNVNLRPPNIPKSTKARMLKLKAQLDIAKYSHWVRKFHR